MTLVETGPHRSLHGRGAARINFARLRSATLNGVAAYILGHELRDCDELVPGSLKDGHQDLDSMDGRDRLALVFSIAVVQKNYVGQAVTQPA